MEMGGHWSSWPTPFRARIRASSGERWRALLERAINALPPLQQR